MASPLDKITKSDRIADDVWESIVEAARWAPTPHNTQPYRIRVEALDKAVLCFDTRRGISATDPKQEFLYVGLGVFVETLRLVAASHGYALSYALRERSSYAAHHDTLCELTLAKDGSVTPDIDPTLIRLRRTSRLPFDGNRIDDSTGKRLQQEGQLAGHRVGFSNNPGDIEAVLRFNTEILFHDLNHTGLRRELAHWIRWTKADYEKRRDGFSAEALNQPGLLMWLFVKMYWLLKLPIIRGVVRRQYEGSVGNVGTVGWIIGPFATQQEQAQAGVLLARLWLLSTSANLYIHPFGSVVTNDGARNRVLEKLGLAEKKGERCWLIFRIGYSAQPARSLRLETKDYFI